MAEKTSTGRLIAAAGGIILIISLFLSWYGISIGGPAGDVANSVVNSMHIDTSFSGWQSLDIGDFFFFLVGLLAILPAALDIFDLELELPFDVGLAITIAGGLSVLWIILRIIDKPGSGTGVANVSLGLKYGIFVALIGAGLVTFGGFTQRGEDEDDAYAAAAAPGAAPAAPPVAPPAAPPAAPQPPAAAPPAAAPPQQQPPPPQQPPAPPAPPQQQPPQPPPPPPAPPAV